MNSFIENLTDWSNAGQPRGFRRVARYNQGMDALVYLHEDCSYRSDRVDEYMTVFWAPDEFRVVGFRLKGIRHLFLEICKTEEVAATEAIFRRVVGVLEKAFFKAAEAVIDVEDRLNRYKEAISLVSGAEIPHEDFEKFSAAA